MALGPGMMTVDSRSFQEIILCSKTFPEQNVVEHEIMYQRIVIRLLQEWGLPVNLTECETDRI